MRQPIYNRFSGRTALVTGGSSGIGRAIVEELAKEGAHVFFSCLPSDDAEARELVDAYPGQVRYALGDMGRDAFRVDLFNACRETFGSLHYLVNNAFSFVAVAADASLEDWQRSLEVGPIAYARMGALVAPEMEKGGGGAIVNISSISAHIAQPYRWTYNASKGAVHQLTRCMAMDFADRGIRVNSVSPGWFWTRENDKAAGFDRERYEEIWGKFHLLKRMGQTVECAAPVLFLLNEDASFITGTDLPVDGGYNAMGPEGLGTDTVVAGSR